LVLGGLGQHVVGGVDAHQGLAPAHGLAGVDQALDDLAPDAEAQLALDPGGDHAGELALAVGRGGAVATRTTGGWVRGSTADVMAAARGERGGQAADEGGESKRCDMAKGSCLER
jgi:hypothetical protein